jgi:hypothetical protein
MNGLSEARVTPCSARSSSVDGDPPKSTDWFFPLPLTIYFIFYKSIIFQATMWNPIIEDIDANNKLFVHSTGNK